MMTNQLLHERKISNVFNAGEWYRIVQAAENLSMPTEQLIRMLVLHGIEKSDPS